LDQHSYLHTSTREPLKMTLKGQLSKFNGFELVKLFFQDELRKRLYLNDVKREKKRLKSISSSFRL
jgi:hypothetical protein